MSITKNKLILGTVIAVFLMILILLLNGYMLLYYKVPEEQGTFGDVFGLSNAIFSGLAFIGIIVTILLQMDELKEQREELRLTRMEMEEQNYTLKLQRFENTFFQLNAKLTDTINNFKYTSTKGDVTGSLVFDYLFSANIDCKSGNIIEGDTYEKLIPVLEPYDIFRPTSIFYELTFKTQKISQNNSIIGLPKIIQKKYLTLDKSKYRNYKIINSEDSLLLFRYLKILDLNEYLDKSYKHRWNSLKPYLSHYYKLLYRVIKFIDQSTFITIYNLRTTFNLDLISEEVQNEIVERINYLIKYKYTSILRAQFTDAEIQILTFNCLWSEGKKMKHFVNKYCLLKNHPDKNLLNIMVDLKLFDESSMDNDYILRIYPNTPNFQYIIDHFVN